MTLSVRECLRFGWNGFKAHPTKYIGAVLIIFALQLAFTNIQASIPDAYIGFFISVFLSTLLYCGIIRFFLNAHDTGMPHLENLWNPAPFLSYFVASLLMTIGIVLGFILLIVPGVLLMLALFFTPYIIVDKQLGPIASMKRSIELTRGNRYRLFLLLLAIMGLVILGSLPLLLGLLVVTPVVGLAGVHAYRTLEGQHALVPVSSKE